MTANGFSTRDLDRARQRRHRRNAGCRRLRRCGSDTLGNIARTRRSTCPICAGWVLATSSRSPDSARRNPRRRLRTLHAGSPGKDTTTGHWEMAGIHLAKPFPLFRMAFRPKIMREFERRIGRSTLGNKAASGTEIIKELGEEHMRTGSPIVYTSADSVFQIAAHEEVIPSAELYRICEIAREILRGPYEVGRVIARPFEGEPGTFHAHRESARLRRAAAAGHAARSTRASATSKSTASARSPMCFSAAASATKSRPKTMPTAWRRRSKRWRARADGLIFVNLVDFDQQYGHRNDVEGYAARARRIRRLAAQSSKPHLNEAIWRSSPPITAAIPPRLPPITAANTRRCSPSARTRDAGVDLGLRATLSDIGQTVAENFAHRIEKGTSFLSEISMRTPLMAGNWKMYKTPAETPAFFDRLPAARSRHKVTAISQFARPTSTFPSPSLPPVNRTSAIGAQNICCGQGRRHDRRNLRPNAAGRSAPKYVIIGHSERRNTVCHETDADVLKKTQAALAAGLRPSSA